jgi:hypothetical protein
VIKYGRSEVKRKRRRIWIDTSAPQEAKSHCGSQNRETVLSDNLEAHK